MRYYEVTTIVTTTSMVEADSVSEAYEIFHNNGDYTVIREDEYTEDIVPLDEGDSPYRQDKETGILMRDSLKKKDTANYDWS